jgi:hypothetical protein
MEAGSGTVTVAAVVTAKLAPATSVRLTTSAISYGVVSEGAFAELFPDTEKAFPTSITVFVEVFAYVPLVGQAPTVDVENAHAYSVTVLPPTDPLSVIEIEPASWPGLVGMVNPDDPITTTKDSVVALVFVMPKVPPVTVPLLGVPGEFVVTWPTVIDTPLPGEPVNGTLDADPE